MRPRGFARAGREGEDSGQGLRLTILPVSRVFQLAQAVPGHPRTCRRRHTYTHTRREYVVHEHVSRYTRKGLSSHTHKVTQEMRNEIAFFDLLILVEKKIYVAAG